MKILKNLIPSNLAVACSGGTDSIALAHFLRRKNPILVHFNHKLLPDDDKFAENVRNFAHKFGLKLIEGEASEAYNKGSVEAWCREQRYNWFAKLQLNLVMAHTLNDCVESYLMRTFQGTPHFAPIPVQTQYGTSNIIRPMMLTTKEEVLSYLNRNNLESWTTLDPLNLDTSKLRNWLRLDLIPYLKERQEINLDTVVKKIVQKQYKKHLTNNEI